MHIHRFCRAMLCTCLLMGLAACSPDSRPAGTQNSGSASVPPASVSGPSEASDSSTHAPAQRVSQYHFRFEDEEGTPVPVKIRPISLLLPDGEEADLTEPDALTDYVNDLYGYHARDNILEFTMAGGCALELEMVPEDHEELGLEAEDYYRWTLTASAEGPSTVNEYVYVFRGTGEALKENSDFEEPSISPLSQSE